MNYRLWFLIINLIVIVLCFDSTFAASFFDWFSWETEGNDHQTPPKQEINLREGVTLISIPFEELNPEDKFLQEAERFEGVSLSGIDSCEHRAVMKIQTSCSTINEEELAKLSIGLLNCQLEVRSKPQIKCTEEMSLKECTSPMDSETWNAYHIINNRARAVCYATRQVQFRALSEMTVNKLMSSALKQLETMDSLEVLQKELSKLTTETVESVKQGQEGLAEQNSGLKLASSQVQNNIVANLRQLNMEKTVIQSMQHQLDTLSKKLSQDLGDVESQLESHSERHQTIHQEIVSKLAEISVKADAVWNAIDERSRKLHKQQEEIRKSTLETMENLKKINSSVSYLLGMVETVRREVDEKISLLTDTIGGDSRMLVSVSQHFLFLLAGVLISLFLQLGVVCRFLLLIAVACNVLLVYHRRSLSFLHLAAAVVGWWVVAVLIPICWAYVKRTKSSVTQKKEFSVKEDDENNEDNLSTRSSSKAGSVFTREDNYREDVFADRLDSLRHRRCGVLCRNGQLCRSTPVPGLDTCRRHITANAVSS